MGVIIKIGLRSRATAPGPTCSASGSLIRARHRVRRGGVRPIGRAYRSLLSTASDGTDPEAPSRWDGPGSSSIRLLAEGKRLRSREMEMKSRSLLKSGSGVAPPHPARPAALPGPFPERRDSEAPSRWDGPGSSSNRLLAEGKRLRSREMEVKWGSLLKSGSGVAPPHPARPAALPGPSFGLGTASVAAESLHDGKDP